VYGAPITHEDDSMRAVSAALKLRSPPAELGFIQGIQIGLSRGQMRTGDYGAATQRTYGVLGAEVNVAARLMTTAQPGQILMTRRIARAVEAAFEIRELEEPLILKGVSAPLKVFEALERRREKAAYSPKRRSLISMVGRAEERAVLAGQLRALVEGKGGCLIIEGEAGMGKSRLLADLLEQAQASAVRVLVGEADAIDKSRPYHAWRPIFARLFNPDAPIDEPEGKAREAWRAHVLTRLAEIDAHHLRLAPLLNVVLPLDLPENELTVQMAGEVRAANTHDLMLSVLQAAAGSSPLLLALDDGHWLDSASWALARLVRRDIHPALLVLAARPMPESPAEFAYLADSAGAERIRLGALSTTDVDRLICQRLGVSDLPQPVADLIHQKAEGHPFFSEELAYALRDTGLIEIAGGECRLAPGVRDLSELDFPDTIQGVITSRIDRLTPQQQLTLKIASVIGRIFAFQMLRSVHPVESDKPYLRDSLSTLERLDITPLEAPEPDLAYIFKHIITQEVAYNLMTFSQRRSLHGVVAEWYERTYAADLSPYYPYLAHHWRHSLDDQQVEPERVVKAIGYLEKSAEQARLNYANQEVVSFLSQALALGDLVEPDGRSLRRARWERTLGDAYLGLGQFGESRAHLEQALALLGQSMPATRGRLILSLLKQGLRQVWHRRRPVRVEGQLPDEAARPKGHAARLEAARALTVLSNLYYFANETGLLLYSLLTALNLAEVVGPSPEVAQASSSMSVIAGLIGLHALADTYSHLAQETAQAVGKLSLQVYVLSRVSLYRTGVGRWPEADADLNRTLEISERLGDHVSWIGGAAVLFLVNAYRGQIARNARLAAEACARARRIGNEAFEVWGLNVQASSLILLGQTDEASRAIETAVALVSAAKGADRVARLSTFGALARIRLVQGDLARVERVIADLAPMVAKSSPTAHGAFSGYDGLAEATLAVWAADQPAQAGARKSPSRLQELQSNARQACQALRRYARVFPVAQPRALLRQGLYEWLAGNPARARRSWHKALARAEKLDMPYDQGLAHDAIGQHLNADDPMRAEHLNRAGDIFADVGSVYDSARVRAALENRSRPVRATK